MSGQAKTTIAVIDYGIGNRRSVEKAVQKSGADVKVTNDPLALMQADGLILPGVGAFPAAVQRLREENLIDLIKRLVASGKPLLGICLGMQLLFESSNEHVDTKGLGLIAGQVGRLNVGDLRLPHIGWNLVTWQRSSSLNEGLGEAAPFYHVHSYCAYPENEECIVGIGEYGTTFVSVVEQENVFGVQFHPEKSSEGGIALLKNYVEFCSDAKAKSD